MNLEGWEKGKEVPTWWCQSVSAAGLWLAHLRAVSPTHPCSWALFCCPAPGTAAQVSQTPLEERLWRGREARAWCCGWGRCSCFCWGIWTGCGFLRLCMWDLRAWDCYHIAGLAVVTVPFCIKSHAVTVQPFSGWCWMKSFVMCRLQALQHSACSCWKCLPQYFLQLQWHCCSWF